MRTLGEIVHPECKISIFAWNQKFLVKVEQGPCEQTFKIDQLDIENEADLRARINEDFITETLARFKSMRETRSRLID